MIFFYKSIIQNIFLEEMCQKSKMDTTIDFVQHPKHSRINIFLNILIPKIWNRGIITLVVRMIERNEKHKTKMSCFNFKVFEKIKQVSSTKLTNWYKNISRWKTNKFFHRLIFPRCEPKSLKILLSSLRASFSKNEKKLFFWKKLTKSKNTGT